MVWFISSWCLIKAHTESFETLNMPLPQSTRVKSLWCNVLIQTSQRRGLWVNGSGPDGYSILGQISCLEGLQHPCYRFVLIPNMEMNSLLPSCQERRSPLAGIRLIFVLVTQNRKTHRTKVRWGLDLRFLSNHVMLTISRSWNSERFHFCLLSCFGISRTLSTLIKRGFISYFESPCVRTRNEHFVSVRASGYMFAFPIFQRYTAGERQLGQILKLRRKTSVTQTKSVRRIRSLIPKTSPNQRTRTPIFVPPGARSFSCSERPFPPWICTFCMSTEVLLSKYGCIEVKLKRHLNDWDLALSCQSMFQSERQRYVHRRCRWFQQKQQ